LTFPESIKDISVFAIPKSFEGHADLIQRNAIKSWTKIFSPKQITLLGDDQGVADVASQFGLGHIPDINRNRNGTPLVDDMFAKAAKTSQASIYCYINADIILLTDFTRAITKVARSGRPFLMVGRRWNLDLDHLWNFDLPDSESTLMNLVKTKGEHFSKAGIDYFVFSNGLLDEIPPFAVGRTAWDNWLIFRAREKSAMVVDASDQVVAIHQNHGYSGFANAEALWKSEEARENQRLMHSGFRNLDDATHILKADGIRSAWTPVGLLGHPLRLTGLFPVLWRLRRFLSRVRHSLTG
jgi:hypothetical protein